MRAQCSSEGTLFPDVAGRDAVVRFDAGDVTSNGGVLVLERAERRVKLLSRFASCFRDHRDPDRVEHTVRQLVTQRVFGLRLGYEDISDHDAVGKDPLLAAACGKRKGDLAGHATLSRLELTRPGATAATRYEKIEMLQERVDQLFADVFVEAHGGRDPGLIVIDVDNSDVPLHGRQEGRFFHGYYNEWDLLGTTFLHVPKSRPDVERFRHLSTGGAVTDLQQQLGHAELATAQIYAAAVSARRRATVMALDFVGGAVERTRQT